MNNIMTDKAKESELNTLHGTVTKVLQRELEAHEVATITDADGNEQIIDLPSVSPAIIAQAIKLLKDNNITATPETDKNLQGLKDILDKKQKHSRLASVSPINAAQENN